MYKLTIHKETVPGFPETLPFKGPEHVVAAFREIVPEDDPREHLVVFLLNRDNKITSFLEASVGGSEKCVIDRRLVALTANGVLAHSVVLVHNHPFGNCLPGISDINETGGLKKALDLFNINLLDHIIIGEDGSYYSFADERVSSFINNAK